jgi:molecular chaperone Hsp33
MPDRIVKGISKNQELRFMTAETTITAEEGRKVHSLSPVKAVIFGKLLTAALLFGADLKDKRFLVTLKTVFKDPADYIIVTANNSGLVKGYPRLTFSDNISSLQGMDQFAVNKVIREQLKSQLKEGVFHVSKDLGMKSPHNGSASMITGEIARDITYYFTVSEQIPSIVGLSVILNEDGSVRKAVGFFVQLLPEAGDETIELLEKNMQRLPEIIDLLEMGMTIEQILSEMILKDIDHEVTMEIPVKYHCDCSSERFKKGLLLLGKGELAELIKGDATLELQCHYCNQVYIFQRTEISRLLPEAD